MQDLFQKALEHIKKLPSQPSPGQASLSNDDKLSFYALFKQATSGENTTKAPSRLKVVEKYKWDAWKKLGKMSKVQARKTYVQKLTKLMPTWNASPKL